MTEDGSWSHRKAYSIFLRLALFSFLLLQSKNKLFSNNHNYSLRSKSLAKWYPQGLKWSFYSQIIENENTSDQFKTDYSDNIERIIKVNYPLTAF
jgi:hypothetical protein